MKNWALAARWASLKIIVINLWQPPKNTPAELLQKKYLSD